MTFVIKDNFERNTNAMEQYHFDIEGYDFVLNRQTIFTDDNGSLLQQDFQKMNFIMKNYVKYDADYLESLHYKNDKNKIPIHYALAANNNRMVNLLLYYMAKIDYSAAHVIQDIFKDLINFQKFEYYLKECPFKTK
jgi:ankyrin repeat protein